MGARRGVAGHPIVWGGLLVAFALQVLLAARMKSATFDEPAHIGAGLSYFRTGDFKLNAQHPPLLKEIGALPLLAIGARWPVPDAIWRQVSDPPPVWLQWQVGSEVLAANGPDRVLFWSRLPFIGLAAALGACLYLWGRRLFGAGTALAALALYVLDPTIVAHAPLVATDVGFAFFVLLFTALLWHYCEHRTLRRLLWCGAALGGALGAKFSAVFLLPIALILVLAAARFIPAAVPRQASNLVDPFLAPGLFTRSVWGVWALLAMGAVAAVVVHALYFFPANPFVYLEGLKRVNADHDTTYMAFMAGEFKPHFWTYYLVAILLKEPLALLALAAIGGWRLLQRDTMASLDRTFLWVPPAAIFAAYTIFSDNLGIRYMIPVLPFLHLAGGAGLAAILRRGGWGRVAGIALLALLVMASAGIHPDHLSYFNEAACLPSDLAGIGADGGTRCGPSWLDDSNVDWGQGLKQIRDWSAGRPPVHTRFAYFGSLPPEQYGIAWERIGTDDLRERPPAGRYVLSGHMLARTRALLRLQHGDGPGNWIAGLRPMAIVGHAYYVYDLP